MAGNTARKTGTAKSAPKAVSAAETETTVNLNRLIHERTRLALVSALAVNDRLTFTELKKLLDTTDGNLSVHARKLEEAGYIACTKGFEGRVPRTEYTITREGKKVLKDYLNHMERIIGAIRKDVK
ncbi:MAG: transcriptional regulator [Candidatus Hydrogenedentes bacterium]|jgi:DNA-binding MarR family transcriptional regulator|nr:transcriptional regulator [Candidatus Hydrogenedentota bacterium]